MGLLLRGILNCKAYSIPVLGSGDEMGDVVQQRFHDTYRPVKLYELT